LKLYDISLTISPDMPVWPGDPSVVLERIESMDAGSHVNVSQLACSVHTGTHVDAPHHFLNDGRTVESLALEVLCGPVLVIHLGDDVDLITAQVLEAAAIPAGTLRLLFKTRNSQLWARDEKRFVEKFVAISSDGADWLMRFGVKLVGVDYLSVAPFKQSDAPHQALLKPGIIILEGLDLSVVPAGNYDLYCLPLKLAGSDGAPARAVLVG
jgi:arylformamidase